MPSKAAAQIQSTTQQFLEIYDITNDVVIMKDGATSMIITVDAMNFGLLAEEEQDAVMYAYAGLLNSLTYPVQIVIHSQTKDVTNYLNLLKEQETKASSAVKQAFIRQYREFVAELIKERNVLDKKFYIVVTATSLEMGLLPPQTVVPGVKQIDINTVEKSVIMDKARSLLEPRRDHLIGQFGRLGLYARQLQTQEIIQLFYTSYNPEAAEGQQITNTRDYVTTVVQAQKPMVAPGLAPTQPVITTEPSAQSAATSFAPPNNLIQNPDIYQAPPALTAIPVDQVGAQVMAEQAAEAYQSALPPAPVAQPIPVQAVEPISAPSTADVSQIAPLSPATMTEAPVSQPIPTMPAPATPVAATQV